LQLEAIRDRSDTGEIAGDS